MDFYFIPYRRYTQQQCNTVAACVLALATFGALIQGVEYAYSALFEAPKPVSVQVEQPVSNYRIPGYTYTNGQYVKDQSKPQSARLSR